MVTCNSNFSLGYDISAQNTSKRVYFGGFCEVDSSSSLEALKTLNMKERKQFILEQETMNLNYTQAIWGCPRWQFWSSAVPQDFVFIKFNKLTMKSLSSDFQKNKTESKNLNSFKRYSSAKKSTYLWKIWHLWWPPQVTIATIVYSTWFFNCFI